MLPKKPIAIKELPQTSRILVAYKARQGQREKGWAWLPVLGVLLVAAAVATVAAIGLLKNFGGRGNDAAISSGQTDVSQRRSPPDAKPEPQVAEAEPTEEPAFPNTPENDEARERAWENENRKGMVSLRSGLWEIGIALDTADRGSCSQVGGTEIAEDVCKPLLSLAHSLAPGVTKDGMILFPFCIKGAVDPLQFWQEGRGEYDCRYTVLSRVDNKIKYSQLCQNQKWTSPAKFGITIHSDTDVSFTLLKQSAPSLLTSVPKSARWLSPSCAESKTKCEDIETCVSTATTNGRNVCMKHAPKEVQGMCANLSTGVSQSSAESACKKPQDEDCVKGLTFAGMSQMEAQAICSNRKNKKAEAACYE